MAFIDEAEIRISSGSGGNGCVSFRREKYVPRGGPNGGNGGRGGSVLMVATRNKSSLLDFKFQPIFQAQRGEHGMGKDMDGRSGNDLIIPVPLGTIVSDAKTGTLVHDFVEEDVPVLVAKGGHGGRGNMNFATSTNQAPRKATAGEPGQTKNLHLELRLLADVGLVGLPNAGKSSFLARVSRATPKIADYPFTTLEPNLGVVQRKGQQFIIADLPGIIEGAANGAGLGHKFLRHASRNRILLHLVDGAEPIETIEHNIQVLRSELSAYVHSLAEREEWIVFTRQDLLTAEEKQKRKELLAGHEGYFISSHSGEGIGELLDAIAERSQSWQPIQNQQN